MDPFKNNKYKPLDTDTNYKIYKVEKSFLIEKLKNIITPDFQRSLDINKIDEIYKESSENQCWFNTHGMIILGKLEDDDDKLYIIDGQHRISAIKKCKNDFMINIQLVTFNSLINMIHYFKSINQNSKHIIEYVFPEKDQIYSICLNIKKWLELDYKSAFSRSSPSTGNRYNIDEFVRKLDDELIQNFYKIYYVSNDSNKSIELNDINYDNGTFLFDTILDINKNAIEKFNKLENNKLYYNVVDKNAIGHNFILTFKNINWVDNLVDEDEEIVINKIREIKPKITKRISNAVWNKYIGRDNAYGKCYSCKDKISIQHFECGHLISHKNGGETEINNLRPFCSECNRQLGSNNFISLNNNERI